MLLKQAKKWSTIVLLLFFVGMTLVNAASTPLDYSSLMYDCPHLKAQESLDLDGIMGKWYVVEVLDHKMPAGKPQEIGTTARVVVDSCPEIKLKAEKTRAVLRLLWSEEIGDLEYTFRYPDSERGPGYWLSTTPQNGTLAEKSYSQFTGTVHVMKAVGNHMVLTFCAGDQPAVDSQLYSLLMSREHTLQKSNIKGVHNLLSRRNLNIVSIRKTCTTAGAAASSVDLLALLVLSSLPAMITASSILSYQ